MKNLNQLNGSIEMLVFSAIVFSLCSFCDILGLE